MNPSNLSRHETPATVAAQEPGPDAPKVLMPIGDATEAMDTLYPFFRVAEDGYRAVVAGPKARLYHMVLHEVPPAAPSPGTSPRSGPATTFAPRWPSATSTRRSTPACSSPAGGRRSTCATTRTCCASPGT